VQLLGEINRASKSFQRGVGFYPGLDDPVHFVTADDLLAVFPAVGESRVRIGRLSAAEEIPVCLDAGRLVLRHAAVVGSTGAGKTSTVVSLLQRFAHEGWPSANIVVIDPHGEYGSSMGPEVEARSVLGTGDGGLQVPYWALPAADILHVFAGPLAGGAMRNRFEELVTQGRREFAAEAGWLSIDPAAVTADTPIPFDIRKVWFILDWENNETTSVLKDPRTACVEDPGNPFSLAPPRFTVYGAGNSAPYRGPSHGSYGTTPELLRLGLGDPRLAFFREPRGTPQGEDPLVEVMLSWLGGIHPVSVLDFSGVPAHASELAIGVVLKLLFEVAVRTSRTGPGIGRPRPVLIVLEEAHRYLGESAVSIAREATNRIAREGRKYGVGLILVTQRPSELPDTALAQCGTLIALRLTNSADQAKIRAALPDSVSGLAAVLPSLRTGEAVITGEALALPARTLVDLPNPAPAADDPSLQSWRQAATIPVLAPALSAWRGAYEAQNG
jgi:hypothetical protein